MSRHAAHPANELRRTVVDYAGDPYGDRLLAAMQANIAAPLQGVGVGVYAGDRGDVPSGQAFAGYAVSPQGRVLEAPIVGGNPILYVDDTATIDTSPSAGPYADPVARLLAQRLAVG